MCYISELVINLEAKDALKASFDGDFSPFDSYLLSPWYMQDTVLGPGDEELEDEIPALVECKG